MTKTVVLFCTLTIVLCAVPLVHAQGTTNGHWGVQGDVAKVNLPRFAVEKIDPLFEKPDISGTAFNVGLVRFHGNGAPSYALQFSKLNVDIGGALQTGPALREIAGSGTVRGFLATKYFNFVARKHISGGLAVGGGIGKLDASYTRHEVFQGVRRFVEANVYNRAIPLFEILGRVDVRPVRFFSVGPFYGIRNSTLALGVAVRIHATK